MCVCVHSHVLCVMCRFLCALQSAIGTTLAGMLCVSLYVCMSLSLCALQSAIGTTLAGMDRLQEAEPYLKEAWDLSVKVDGPEGVCVCMCIVGLCVREA